MAVERRKRDRVSFDRALAVQMLGVGGDWVRDCMMEDVSATGAKLTLAELVDEEVVKEFFLLLSMTGLAYRRCELAWMNGKQLGVTFVPGNDRKKAIARRGGES